MLAEEGFQFIPPGRYPWRRHCGRNDDQLFEMLETAFYMPTSPDKEILTSTGRSFRRHHLRQ